jgi:hypothetical protein
MKKGEKKEEKSRVKKRREMSPLFTLLLDSPLRTLGRHQPSNKKTSAHQSTTIRKMICRDALFFSGAGQKLIRSY